VTTGPYLFDEAFKLSADLMPPKLILAAGLMRTGLGGNAASSSMTGDCGGQRNALLFRTGRALKAKGLSAASIRAAIEAENKKRCKPPLDAREIRTIISQVLNTPDQADFKPSAQPRSSGSGSRDLASFWTRRRNLRNGF